MSSTRTILGSIALALLLVTAGCVGALGTAENGFDGENDSLQDSHQNESDVAQAADGATITVGGSGTVEADPDAAVVRLGVTTTGDDPDAVRDRLNEQTNRLRDGLTEIGIDDDQIRTERFHIREDRRTRDQPDREQYEGVHLLAIELEDVDRVGDVIDTAVDHGATDVDRIHFTLSEERRDELREDALLAALDDARSDADVLAQGAGLAVTDVDSIRADGVHTSPYRAPVAEAEMADGGTSIDSGPVTVSASVQVTYNASEA